MSGKAISSDIGIANARANAIKSASNSLKQTRSVDKDHQTTVRGNKNAAEAIMKTHQIAQSISESVDGASSQLSTVASNFEATDNQASKSLFSPLPKVLNK